MYIYRPTTYLYGQITPELMQWAILFQLPQVVQVVKDMTYGHYQAPEVFQLVLV